MKIKPKKTWTVAVAVAAVAAGLALSYKPWTVYHQQRVKTDHNIKEMQQAESSREELIREKNRIEPSLGRERLARDQGYLKPGEQLAQNSK